MDKTIDLSDIMSDFSLNEVLEKIDTEDLIGELNDRDLTYDEQKFLRNVLEEYGFVIIN